MISPGDLAVIVGLNVVGAASPGPDVVLITRTATRSRAHARAVAAGILVGVLMWSTLTVLGAAALLRAFPWVLTALQIVGGVVLVAMGIANASQGLKDRHNPPADLHDAEARLGSARDSFIRGLSTNLANPKIVFALSAMIAPLLPASPSALTAVAVILALWLSTAVLFGVLTQVISTKRVQRRLLAAGPFIDICAGGFFVAVGAAVFVRGALSALG
ncbi:Threonine/homoserine/homoserine lactone efflux protein [Corynebacterium mycetoides]|uniref:Threonine/homoserine/homoserine lactone efflux protein n=1 Tax=Corynebacterium mycetoides TaxID=38302 RepID=A0A1G9NN29_9CORY|nr:Threonine/homoserine/homoserine lactone efflux protein [Corynebacterium mycetoides]